MTLTETLDRMFIWLLRVQPQLVDDAPADAPQERAFGLALLISGLRCTLQYMVLPVALPLIGIASGASLLVAMLLDALALGLLVSSLRYFWRTLHPRRFDILPLTGVMLLLVLGSLGYDIWTALR